MCPQESIQNFVLQLDRMAAQVFPTMPQDQLQNLKFVKLLAQLSPVVKLMVLQHTKSDYNMAVEKATLVQKCNASVPISSAIQKSPMSENVNVISSKSSDQRIYVPKRNRKFENKSRFNQTPRIQQNSKNVNRYKFQNRGVNNGKRYVNQHNPRYQQKFNQRNKGNANNASLSESKDPQGMCQFCRKQGHSARFCKSFYFTSKTNDNQNSSSNSDSVSLQPIFNSVNANHHRSSSLNVPNSNYNHHVQNTANDMPSSSNVIAEVYNNMYVPSTSVCTPNIVNSGNIYSNQHMNNNLQHAI